MLLAALLVASSLSFPISSLGNCNSLSSCEAYCEIPWHRTVCTNYGIEQGVLVRPQILAAVDVSYPIAELGNCGSKAACKSYCDSPTNRVACVNFARAHGIDISVAASEGRAPSERPGGDLTGLTFPIAELGGCASVQACKIYCDQPANRQACFNFAYEKGLVGGEKAAEKLSGLSFPIPELGNCGSLSECEVYCQQPDHRNACSEYAKARGFEPPKHMAGPGGCSNAEECDAYCSNPAHREECEAAWQEHCAGHPDWPECQKGPGGRGGPGGCTSDEECRAYCEQHPDDEDCQRGREEYCQQHPDECQWQTGPGGCVSEEECRLYCQQNPNDEECRRGQEEWCREHPDECLPAGEAGREGPGIESPCHSDEECQRYCQQNPDSDYCRQANEQWCREHPEECAARDEPSGPSGPGGPPAGEAGYPSECGGMDCAEFCRQNPDAEYCLRADEEYCQRNPDQCASPEGDYGPDDETYYGPGGCMSEEECRDYCSKNQDDPECQPH